MPITKASSSAVAPGAKGDLVVGNATNDSGILAVGANGTVLTADSTAATGVAWATAASGGMTLLSTTTLSSTSLTISSISQSYKSLVIIGQAITFAGADRLNCSLRNGASNLSTRLNGVINTTASLINDSQFPTNGVAASILTGEPESTGFLVRIDNYSTGQVKPMQLYGHSFTTAAVIRPYNFQGACISVNAVNALNFYSQNGQDMVGTILIYGVN